MKKVCIVGLGYVGLPLALLAVDKGYSVFGFDINEKHIQNLSQGEFQTSDVKVQKKYDESWKKIHFSSNESILIESDVIIICVPTPVSKDKKPDLEFLKSATHSIRRNLRLGQLIIVESTIFPGTTEEIILPILVESGLQVGSDFWLTHCPERIDPGNVQYGVDNIHRVLGGITPPCAQKALEFYQNLLSAPVTALNCIKAVETTKIVENTFRDVNIALVNELAKSFDALGIDVLEVIKGASSKPFAYMPHFPGCGVGGHCIPVDPYYLIERSRQEGFDHKFLALAREINSSMPAYTVNLASKSLDKLGINNGKIAVLGLAYKKNIEDIRESPALQIIKELEQKAMNFVVFDPFVPKYSTVTSINEALRKVDCVIIATDHTNFTTLNPQTFKDSGVKIIVDGRNCLNKDEIERLGIVYKGIGR